MYRTTQETIDLFSELMSAETEDGWVFMESLDDYRRVMLRRMLKLVKEGKLKASAIEAEYEDDLKALPSNVSAQHQRDAIASKRLEKLRKKLEKTPIDVDAVTERVYQETLDKVVGSYIEKKKNIDATAEDLWPFARRIKVARDPRYRESGWFKNDVCNELENELANHRAEIQIEENSKTLERMRTVGVKRRKT